MIGKAMCHVATSDWRTFEEPTPPPVATLKGRDSQNSSRDMATHMCGSCSLSNNPYLQEHKEDWVFLTHSVRFPVFRLE